LSLKILPKDLRKLRLDFLKLLENKLDIIIDDGSFKNPFHKIVFEKAVKL